MYASRDFQAGEVVFKNQYSLIKLKKEFVDKYCSNCLEPNPQVECEGSCKLLKYCNVGCMEEHRQVHKQECFGRLSLVPERVRFVGLAMATGPN